VRVEKSEEGAKIKSQFAQEVASGNQAQEIIFAPRR